MRKAISLIELIFTIVIIAVVFTVIPKIVLALSKSDEFAIKQDALFNGMTMMQMISRLSWDENSTASNDILQTLGDAHFTCNATTGNYRIGGFRGSRNCENNISIHGPLGTDGEANRYLYNDIDDFNDQNITTSTYGLHVKTKYINDAITYSGQNANIVLTPASVPPSTNLKIVDINITYEGNRGVKGTNISQFSYVSCNIGKFFIGKRTW